MKPRNLNFVCQCKILLFIAGFISSACATEVKEKAALEMTQQSSNALLIFLDDSEQSLGAISIGLLSAIEAESAPILASASLLALVHKPRIPADTPMGDLIRRYNELQKEKSRTAANDQKKIKEIDIAIDDISLALVAFTAQKAEKWIIKEVNTSLYLLLPKKMLQEKKINFDSVTFFSVSPEITQTEFDLGLKISHMKTVAITDIKKSDPVPYYADYFTKSLNSIFVINSEYVKNKNSIPSWAIYISGHGLINDSIVGLAFDQFKKLLSFLEAKITTKVFIYISCYATGTNAEIIYKDVKKEITKVYPFTIITAGLTDTTVALAGLHVEVKPTILQPIFLQYFAKFLTKISSSVSDYNEAIDLITPKDIRNIYQIRYPGLPWFSILDRREVVIIDSIMAKTRLEPLIITKKGSHYPIGILISAPYIPFELILNIPINPTFVSMIPGDAVHYIARITCRFETSYEFLNSFDIESLKVTKVFFINEVVTRDEILKDVVIILEQGTSTKYYTEQARGGFAKGRSFKVEGVIKEGNNPTQIMTDKDLKMYEKYLRQYSRKPRAVVPIQPINELKEKADKIFSQKMSVQEAERQLAAIIDAMPDNSVLPIKLITGKACSYESYSHSMAAATMCWYVTLFQNLAERYQVADMHKIVKIDKLVICYEGEGCSPLYVDIIIDITQKGARIFVKAPDGTYPRYITSDSINQLKEDYVATYNKMFAYYDQHKTLDQSVEKEINQIEKRSIHVLLTPENITKLIEAEAKKRERQKKEEEAAPKISRVAKAPAAIEPSLPPMAEPQVSEEAEEGALPALIE